MIKIRRHKILNITSQRGTSRAIFLPAMTITKYNKFTRGTMIMPNPYPVVIIEEDTGSSLFQLYKSRLSAKMSIIPPRNATRDKNNNQRIS